ncbi:MAG: hypothetical protein U0183_31600 [Polyangiaceae bacterium]
MNQHVHSARSIARFGDAEGTIVVRRCVGVSCFQADASSECFVAKRVWSNGLERGIFFGIETRFQVAVDAVISDGKEVDHAAVSDYAMLWWLRDFLRANPPADVALNGIGGDALTQDEEEIIEAKGAGFVREGGVVPARLASDIYVRLVFDARREGLAKLRWRLARTPQGQQLVCPDAYASGEFGAIPISPNFALVATAGDTSPTQMSSSLTSRLNLRAWADARSLVFAHPSARATLERFAVRPP